MYFFMWHVLYVLCFINIFSGKIDNLPICISFCGNRGDRPNPFNLLFHLNSSSGGRKKAGGEKKEEEKKEDEKKQEEKRRRTHDYNFNQINLQIRFNVFALIANNSLPTWFPAEENPN